MASQRAVCPRCGSFVGIPALKPNTPDGAPPMTPLERLRHARDRKPAPPAFAPPAAVEENPEPALLLPPTPDGTRRVRPLPGHAPPRPPPPARPSEGGWYRCLPSPLRASRLCRGLAVVLTALPAAVAMLLPRLLADPPAGPLALAAFHAGWLAVVLVAAGLPCGFLDAVLES